MAQKRELERKALVYYLKIFEQDSDELLGRLGDITEKGFLLISDKGLPVEKEFDLRMKLPDTYPDEDEIEFIAESVWSQKDVNPDFYATGFKITGISSEAKQTISELIDLIGL